MPERKLSYVKAGLNKGEARHALARAVFFNRLGEVRDRSFENQCYHISNSLGPPAGRTGEIGSPGPIGISEIDCGNPNCPGVTTG